MFSGCSNLSAAGGRVVKSAVVDDKHDRHGRGSKLTRAIFLYP